MACGHTAIRQSCIIFIYNGVPPTYDTSPKMLLVKIWPKTVLFFCFGKILLKDDLEHSSTLSGPLNMTNLDNSSDFARYCIFGGSLVWYRSTFKL